MVLVFHIGLHIRDLAVLELMKKELGSLGKIYVYENKNEAHYAITRKEELKQFISKVFNSKNQLLTDYQYNRFIILKTILDKDLKSTTTKEEFDKLLKITFSNYNMMSNDLEFLKSWGFINGEGSFYIVKNDTVFRFAIEHTDIKVLYILKECINLSVNITEVKIRGTRKQTYCMSTTSKENINKVISFIDNNNQLQGYKLEQYNKFKNSFIESIK